MAIQDYNFGGLKARVWFNLQNLPKYTDEFLGVNVNKAVEWLYTKARISQIVYQATTVPDQIEYELPANTIEIQSVSYAGVPLNRMSLSQHTSTGIQENDAAGFTTDYFIQTEGTRKYLSLYPKPASAEALEIWGIMLPARMALDADPLPVEEVHSDALEAYATFLTVKGQPEEEARAAQWFQIAEGLIKGTVNVMRADRTFKIKRARL